MSELTEREREIIQRVMLRCPSCGEQATSVEHALGKPSTWTHEGGTQHLFEIPASSDFQRIYQPAPWPTEVERERQFSRRESEHIARLRNAEPPK